MTTSREPAPAPTWEDFKAEAVALYRAQRSASSAARASIVCRELAAHSGAPSPAALEPAAVARWLDAEPMRRRAPLTVRTHLSACRALCSYAVGRGYLPRSPFGAWTFKVRGGMARVTARRHHTAAELAAVLARLDAERGAADAGLPRWKSERLFALFCVAAFTGMRRSEILRLKVADFDLENGLVSVVDRGRILGASFGTKTAASAAPVPMADYLVETMRVWLPLSASDWAFPNPVKGGPWRGRKPLARLKAAGVRAGVHGLTFQGLRHSWATHAESLWGLSEPLIQRVLRHTSPRTSREHYRHADAANLRAAVRGLTFQADERGRFSAVF